jgi:PAS domain S-box-containing protein
MNENTFPQQIEAAFQRLEAVQQQVGQTDVSPQKPVQAALQELSMTLEGLRTLGEALHRQNEALVAARDNLAAEGQHYQELFEFAPGGYLVTDCEGVILEANRLAATQLNRDQTFLRGKPLAPFIAVEDRQNFQHILTRLQEGSLVNLDDWELAIQPDAGSLFPAALNVAAARDAEDRLIGLRWLMRDISHRKQIENTLRESEKRFRTVADFTYDWEYWLSPGGELLYTSLACQRITGYDPDKFLEEPGLLVTIVHPEDRRRMAGHMRDEEAKAVDYALDFRIISRTGEMRWIGHVCQPVYDLDGTFLGRRVSNRDISQRKQAEEALQCSTQRLEILHELDRIILAAWPLEAVAQTTLENLQRLIPYYRAEILVFDFAADEATTLAVQMAGLATPEEPSRLPLEKFRGFEEFWQGQVHRVEDILTVRQPGSVDQLLQMKGVRAYLNLPLIAQTELLGILNLGWDQPGPVEPKYVEIGREVAAQLAVAIRQARLQEQVQRYTTELEQRVAERTTALNQERNFISAILDTTAALVAVTDVQGRLVRFNRTCERISGYTFEQVKGKTLWDLFLLPEEVEPVRSIFEQINAGQFPSENENHWVARDGSQRLIAWSNTALLDPAGAVEYVVGTGIDITERKRTEEALRESEELHRITLSNISDAIFITDDAGRFTYVCPNVDFIFGYSPQEIKQLGHITKLLGDDLFDPNELETQGEIQNVERQVVDKAGRKHILLVNVRRVSIKGGTVLYTCHDISERMQLQEAYQRLVEHSLQGLAIIQDVRVVFANPTLARMTGYTVDEMLAFPPDEARKLVHPEDQASIWQRAQSRLIGKNNTTPHYEFRFVHKDGRVRWFEVYISPIEYQEKPALQVATIDITERKQAEVALAQERDLLHTLMDNIPDRIYFKDIESRFTRINRAQARALGVKSPEAAIGKTDFDFFEPELAKDFYADEQEIIKSGRPLIDKVEQYRETDGQLCWVSATKVPIVDGNGEISGIVGISRDISAWIKSEERLRASQERYRQIFENSPISLWEEDFSAVKQYSDQLRREGIRDFRAYCDENPDVVMECGAGVRVNEVNQATLRLYQAERKEELLGDLTKYLGQNEKDVFKEELIALAEGQTNFEREVTTTTLRGEGRHIKLYLSVAPGYEETLSKVLVSIIDLTERKRAEDENSRLLEAISQQHEHLRSLAARLADVEETERKRLARELHDQVGQNLTALGLNLNIIQAQVPPAWPEVNAIYDRLADSLTLVEDTTERIRDVMADLRPPVLDDYGLVAALDWYGTRFAVWTGLPVTVQGEEPEPRLAASVENALFRIAQEALTNAAKHAQANQVTVTVAVGTGTVRLIVADDGIGFEPAGPTELAKRQSWGLLNITERTEAAGGRCRIVSRSGQGTRVIVEVGR